MAYVPRIVAFAGSLRTGSFNKRLAKVAAAAAQAAGASVTYADLRDYPIPLFDEDLERQSGLPAEAKRFKELLTSHDGFLIASPEYNSAFSGVMKNAIIGRRGPKGRSLRFSPSAARWRR